MNLTFNVGYQTHGFRDGNERPELAYNGMFFDSELLSRTSATTPASSWTTRAAAAKKNSAQSPICRRAATRGAASPISLRRDSDWISYHTTVSTPDDQIAFAPGYLQRDWHQNGRHYYAYDMGDVKILDFFAYISGRYNVKKRELQGRQHRGLLRLRTTPWDVDDMMEAAQGRPRLLPGQLQPLPVQAVPHHRVPALPAVCAVLPQHRPFHRDLLDLARARSEEGHRLHLLRHRA